MNKYNFLDEEMIIFYPMFIKSTLITPPFNLYHSPWPLQCVVYGIYKYGALPYTDQFTFTHTTINMKVDNGCSRQKSSSFECRLYNVWNEMKAVYGCVWIEYIFSSYSYSSRQTTQNAHKIFQLFVDINCSLFCLLDNF